MRSTLQKIDAVYGKNKFHVLAAEVDCVKEALECHQDKVSVDDQLETLDMHELANKYDVSFDTLRKQITSVLCGTPVYKVGKKWVIRKRRFLDFLEAKESQSDT